MTHTIKLSKRLTTIASFLPENTFFADIGTDHAFLPCYVCLSNPHAKAIAGEVNEGPYKAASKTVNSYKLSNSIDVRLGDGLHVIKNDQITELVIAGMGGALIATILEQGNKYLQSVKRIIVQPNIGERTVRKWLVENGFTIANEVIIGENNHLYEIIVADKDTNEQVCFDKNIEKQLLFGPELLKNKTPLFYEKWRHQQKKLTRILEEMKQATNRNDNKINQLNEKLEWIKEVLLDENK